MTSLTYVREVYEDGKIAGMEAGRQEGRAETVLELLSELGEVPEELRLHIYSETDLKCLIRWVKLAARAGSVEEFTEKM